MANHFSVLALRHPWTLWKGKKRTLKDELPRSVGAPYNTGISEEITPERMKRWSQSKNKQTNKQTKKHPVVDVTGDGSKVQCCKEQYCIGMWNIRSINQINLKWSNRRWQEWTSTLLGISELKWTGMGEFNSNDHYIYYCGQESFRRNGVAIIVNKRVQNVVLECNLKNDRMISVHFQSKPFIITVLQVYALTIMLKKLKLNGSMKTYKTF